MKDDIDPQFLKGLTDAQFKIAKRNFTYVNISRLIILLANFGIIFGNAEISNLIALVSAAVAIISVSIQIRVDRYKSLAEALLRQYEENEGLGWPISKKAISDIMASLPAKLRQEASDFNLPQPYYASQAPKSPRRLIENLEESAWWTKHLSSKMVTYTFLFVLTMLSLSFIALVTILNSAASYSFERNVARAVVSVIAFLFSGGMIRLWLDYRQLNENAARAENIASQILARPDDPDIVDVARVIKEYQIARASSPLIPDWVFKQSHSSLDIMWKRYRAR